MCISIVFANRHIMRRTLLSISSLVPSPQALHSVAASAHALLASLFGAPPTPPSMQLAGAGCAPLPWATEREAWDDDKNNGEMDEGADAGSNAGGLVGALLRRGALGAARARSSLSELAASIWLAVPKRKKSYSRKRQRQLNPRYAATDVQNFYPCPKCEKGLLKLRHHVCPCDQELANVCGVRKVRHRAGASFFCFVLLIGLPNTLHLSLYRLNMGKN